MKKGRKKAPPRSRSEAELTGVSSSSSGLGSGASSSSSSNSRVSDAQLELTILQVCGYVEGGLCDKRGEVFVDSSECGAFGWSGGVPIPSSSACTPPWLNHLITPISRNHGAILLLPQSNWFR